MPFIPHTDDDVEAMLAEVGVPDLEALFGEIPDSLKTVGGLHGVGPGFPEMEMLRQLAERAKRDESGPCFIGAGAYDHHIPAAVWDLASRGEFMTAYTPYQAEASQGTLQLIYEFQTMMAGLTGLDVSNASVYDGGSGLGEAILMAIRSNRRSRSRTVLIAGAVNPYYVAAARTIVKNQGVEIVVLPDELGLAELASSSIQDPVAVVVQQPNFFGLLENVDALTDWAHERGALVVAVVNPLTASVLRPPGQWGASGADIACGDGQPLGIPMSSGGPSFGFICARSEHVRQMPGRIIGRTEDLDGRSGYVLTLQAREQHIRRAKATSNICTNQGLLVTAATIHMSLLGAEGMRRVAMRCHAQTTALVDRLTRIDGVSRAFEAPFFHECLLDLGAEARSVVEQVAESGVIAGLPMGALDASRAQCLLVCATEKRTDAEIEELARVLESALAGNR